MGEKEDTPEVNREDQGNINLFGRLNNKFHQLQGQIKDRKTRIEHLEEAGNELMLVDDEEAARYLVGECFLHISNENAEERINAETEVLTTEVEKLGQELEEVQTKMADLKAVLYKKFGKNINLDEDPED